MGARVPSVSSRNAIRALERAGFSVLPRRGKGSHVAMGRDGWGPILVLPRHDDVPRGTLRALIRQAGMSVEEFVALL